MIANWLYRFNVTCVKPNGETTKYQLNMISDDYQEGEDKARQWASIRNYEIENISYIDDMPIWE